MKLKHKLLVIALILGVSAVSLNLANYHIQKSKVERLYYLLAIDVVRVGLYAMDINSNVTFARAEEMEMPLVMIELSKDEFFYLVKDAKVIYWEESVEHRFFDVRGYNHYYINRLGITYQLITEVWVYWT